MSSAPKNIVTAMAAVLTAAPKAVRALAKAGASGKWTHKDQADLLALLKPIFGLVENSYKSLGVVFGVQAGFVVEAEVISGVVLDLKHDCQPYAYSFFAASIGLSEGASGSAGIFLAPEVPSDLAKPAVFSDANFDLGGGVGVQVSADGQIMVVLGAGEEVEVSVGGGAAKVKKLKIA